MHKTIFAGSLQQQVRWSCSLVITVNVSSLGQIPGGFGNYDFDSSHTGIYDHRVAKRLEGKVSQQFVYFY